ncbi:uncharacterized protein LOC142178388 [Nicotiana tabacum]|uniref:Uncharacterized protein LOC142178388 n=1 Tax=Nicotiana tabacum TaxID=4097 RepID=A0AC58U2Y1_TOBAC
MHTYYIKQGEAWNVRVKQAAWLTQKILGAAIQGRLYTRDRLIRWGSITTPVCALCEEADEDHEHLFFECKYSATIWGKLLQWAGISRVVKGWTEEISWATSFASGRRSSATLYRLMLTCAVYHIWQERNWRIFRNQKRLVEDMEEEKE